MRRIATARSLEDIARLVDATLVGDGHLMAHGVASLESASAGDLVFVDGEEKLEAALQSPAVAVIAGMSAAVRVSPKPLLLARQPRLAFARAVRLLCQEDERQAGVHDSAVVSPSARLADQVAVEARAVIGDNVDIGAGTRIGAGCVIAAGVTIGRDCDLYPNVTIYSGARLGDRVIVHAGAVLGSDGFGYVRDDSTGRYEKFPQVGSLQIDDDVEIGANTTVDRGALDVTRIAHGTKIDNLVHVGHNAQIGAHVVISAQTGISGSAVIEEGVVIAGQVGIADHVRIESGAILGAQSGVPTRKVIRGKGVVFWGTPARPIRDYLKELATLARLSKGRR
jgi:UDP-3-O-[3-hydroxymyristoyl] glucosamine N-acyltransferase